MATTDGNTDALSRMLYRRASIDHFNTIPWCRRLLQDPALIDRAVDRRLPGTTEDNVKRRVLNLGETLRACVVYFRTVTGLGFMGGNDSPTPVTTCAALLVGGGLQNGEDSRAPFLVVSALVELEREICSYQNELHRQLCNALMTEIMRTAAVTQTTRETPTAKHKHSVSYRYMETSSSLPRIVVVRGRVIKVVDHKIYARATIEAGDGTILCEGDSYWVKAN